MRKKLLITACVFFALLIAKPLIAQINILNANINQYNITPGSLCDVNIMNYQEGLQVVLEAKLINSNNEPILIVRTNPFLLAKGMNSSSGLNFGISSIVYASSAQANYIKSSHSLPSGKFSYCCTITSFEENDEYCEDIESDLSSFLLLISPNDKDTIETENPLLIWSHSEPFNISPAGEFFRITLVEINSDQNAETAITTNPPLYMKNALNSHQVQYPFDASKLQKGKRYGWQVQKLINGVITNKTEAWEFIIEPDKVIKENKYVSLKRALDAGYYKAGNNKVFFKFDEEYMGGNLECTIFNDKRERILPKIKNEDMLSDNISMKNNGYNRFEINLNELNISSGFHVLEVKNEKGELYLLKILVE